MVTLIGLIKKEIRYLNEFLNTVDDDYASNLLLELEDSLRNSNLFSSKLEGQNMKTVIMHGRKYYKLVKPQTRMS